jgi:hypothetical protein
MKEKIFELLKTQHAGVSDAILNRMCEKLAQTIKQEEDVKTAVEAVTLQQIIEAEADRRATEATKTATANYEKKYGLKDGQKVDGGAPKKDEPDSKPQDKVDEPIKVDTTKTAETPKANDDTPAWAKVLIESIKSIKESNEILKQELEAIKGEKITNTRKQRVSKVIENAPEAFRNFTIKSFEKASFKDDDDFNTYLDDITKDTDGVLKEFAAKGAVFGVPTGSGGQKKDQPTNEQVQEVTKMFKI